MSLNSLFVASFLKPCRLLGCQYALQRSNYHLHQKRYYQFQGQEAKKMLIRKDGKEMTVHEMQSLFNNIATILEEVTKDPKNFEPSDIDEVEKLISEIREIKLEYAPPQLKFLSSNFMVWFHSWKSKKVYKNLYLNEQYNKYKPTRINQFTEFSNQLLKWSTYLSIDMDIVWKLLENIDIITLTKDMENDSEEDTMKIIRNLRINSSLYLNKYNTRLLASYNDIMTSNDSLKFLEFDEATLALTASPFLGKFNVMYSIINRLTQEKEKETKLKHDVLINKVLDLPTGLNWENLYNMYNDNKYCDIIQNWEDTKRLFQLDNELIERNTNDLCWFKMDHFKSSIIDIDIGSIVSDPDNNQDWNTIREQYLENSFNIECDEITKNNSLIRKMGNTAQIICLLGSEQSVFGENILHLTGLWLDNFSNNNGDGDRILVSGKNKLTMDVIKDDNGKDIHPFLVHEESWDLYQQYSLDKDTIYVAGMCNTEQRIQSHFGEKLSVPNIPSYVRMRTQIQMTLVKQQT